jgi:hypothetical protein
VIGVYDVDLARPVPTCVTCGQTDYGLAAPDPQPRPRHQGTLELQLPSAAQAVGGSDLPMSYVCRSDVHSRCHGRAARGPGRVNHLCPCECHR